MEETKSFVSDIECPYCEGTGLYVGVCERDGSAVICYQCNGTGCYRKQFNYTLFQRKRPRTDVKRVYETAGGYGISAEDVVNKKGETIKFSQAGVSYEDWFTSGKKPWPIRDLHCPLQHTCQQWESPIYCRDTFFGGLISECPMRHRMAECWKLYDEEMKESENTKK
jgi:hypothetical protein